MNKLVLVLAAAFSAASFADEVDGMVAIVGTTPVLKSDVIDAMRGSDVSDMSRFDEFRNKLIERRLILLAASDSKMTMQEWLVDNRVGEIIRDNFAGDRNKLIEALARQKIPFSEWRRHLKEEMIVSAMRWQVVASNAKASPRAMRKEYADHPERYKTAMKASLSVILLKPEDASMKDEVDKALQTSSFEDVAKKYSVDIHAADGGLWKDVDIEQAFRPEICEAFASVKEGETTPWIELDGWNFLLRKNSETGVRAQSFAEAYDAIERNVKEAEAARLHREWIDRLKKRYYIRMF